MILPVSLTFHTSRRNSCTSFYSTPRDSRDLCNTGPPRFHPDFPRFRVPPEDFPQFFQVPIPVGQQHEGSGAIATHLWVGRFRTGHILAPLGFWPHPCLRQHEGIVAIATHLWWVAFARVTSSRTSGSGLIRRCCSMRAPRRRHTPSGACGGRTGHMLA